MEQFSIVEISVENQTKSKQRLTLSLAIDNSMCKQENFLRHKETPVTKSRLFLVLHLICWDIIWFQWLSWKCHFTTVKILYLNEHFFAS